MDDKVGCHSRSAEIRSAEQGIENSLHFSQKRREVGHPAGGTDANSIAQWGLECVESHPSQRMRRIRHPAVPWLNLYTPCDHDYSRSSQTFRVDRGYSWLPLSAHRPVREDATNCHAHQKNSHKKHEYEWERAAKGTESIGYQHGAILGLSRCLC